MITRAELNPHGTILTEAQEANLTKLLLVMNRIRSEYGFPMQVTSGFRTHEDQMRINPGNPNSLHTKGAAVDIADPDPAQRLWNWCIDNLELMVDLGVWLEARIYSHNHVHFQIASPVSGHRIFIP